MIRPALVIAIVVIASACGKHDARPAGSASSGSSSAGSNEAATTAGSAATSAGAAGTSAGSAATSAGAAGTSAGSAAGGASADPWAKPAGDAPCDDADIQRHIDASLAASLAYLTALEHTTARWRQDCEAARKDLLALEPEATKFMTAMQQFMTWAQTLSPACGKRVGELGEQTAGARDIEKRTPGIEAKVKPMLERCKDHPGFQEAAAKGLRLLRRKHE